MLLAVLLCSCASGLEQDTSPLMQPAQDTRAPVVQIAPPSCLKLPSWTEDDVFRLGKDYGQSLPHNRVQPVFNAARFTPDWDNSSGPIHGLAYAIYSFNLSGYDGEEAIHFSWYETADFSNAWVAVADFARNRWHWFPMPELGVLEIEFDDYTSSTGQMLVLPLFTGVNPWELAWLRCGESPGSWFHSWGLAADDGVSDICIDDDGNAYLCGITTSLPSHDESALLVKYDIRGGFKWARTWGRGYKDRAAGVCADSDGNVYITGETCEFDGSVKADCFILKFSENGSLLWQRRWGGEKHDDGSAAIVDNNGDIYIGGCADFNNALILKYSRDGTPIWAKSWGADPMDGIYGLFLDQEGALLAAGYTRSAGAGNQDILLLKLNATGELILQRAWGESNNENATSVAVNREGDICLTGSKHQQAGTFNDALVLQCDSIGNLKWAVTWGGIYGDCSASCELDGRGDAYTAFWSSTSAGVKYVLSRIGTFGLDSPGYVFEPVINDPIGIFYGLDLALFPDDSLAVAGDMINAQTGGWAWHDSVVIPVDVEEHIPEYSLSKPSGVELSCGGSLESPTGIMDSGGGHTDQTIQRIDNPWR